MVCVGLVGKVSGGCFLSEFNIGIRVIDISSEIVMVIVMVSV